MQFDAKAKARKMTIEAVVTRADGTVENLGVISYWHKNPIYRWLWKAKCWIKSVWR